MEIKSAGIEIPRHITEYHSFDRAFSPIRLGFPAIGAIEIFGPTGVGKSTLSYSLSALLGKITDKNICLFDTEGCDEEFITAVMTSQGFDGVLLRIDEATHNKSLDEVISVVEEYPIGIVDSIGALMSVQEEEGDIGDANMGVTAKMIKQFHRKIQKNVRDFGFGTYFLTNHMQPDFKGFGMYTPGGKSMEYMSAIRIRLHMKAGYPSKKENNEGYVVEGLVEKCRWGGTGRKFTLFILGGQGIHRGMTAIFDAINLGLTEEGRTIKIGDESFGYVKNIIAKAQEGDEEFFQPFYQLLEKGE